MLSAGRTGAKGLLFLALLLCAISARAADPPVLFFTDLVNGPATGNSDTTYETNGGVYLTIYGNFFGATQGASTITLNGASCLHVITWGQTWLWYQRIVVQLKSACTTGNLVVTTSNGTSNALPFTVNSGTIYYIAVGGSDSNSGTFASPFASVRHAVENVAGLSAGNIVYARNGVVDSTDDGAGWTAVLTIGGNTNWCQGTASQPDALIGYPGATAQVGPTTGSEYAMRGDPTLTACPGNWTFGELTWRSSDASSTGVDTINFIGDCDTLNGHTATGVRFIGNDISNVTPSGDSGEPAVFDVNCNSGMEVLGNYFHDMNTGAPTTNVLAQGTYLSTDSNFLEYAWNETYNEGGGRTTLQVHSSPLGWRSTPADHTGYVQYGINIHDNKIHKSVAECLVLDTISPAKGAILVWNNLFYDCGTLAASNGYTSTIVDKIDGDYQLCFAAGTNGGNNAGPCDAGTSAWPVWIYNNTFYCNDPNVSGSSCDEYGNDDVHSGNSFPQTKYELLQNNVFFSANANTTYFLPEGYTGSFCSSTDTFGNDNGAGHCPMKGDHNLIAGNGTSTGFANLFSSTVASDPTFVNASTRDFHLQSGSPAIGAGVAIPAVTGTIIGAFVDTKGAGCSSISISLSGGGGSGASLTGDLLGGVANTLQTIQIIAGGSGYSVSSPPSLVFTGCTTAPTGHVKVGNLPALTYDIDGRIRPNPPSIGAYELTGAGGGGGGGASPGTSMKDGLGVF